MSVARTFYLWKFAKDDGRFSFFHQDELPDAGFSSVYGVSEEDAQKLVEAGSYAGFRGIVHNSTLWVDTDSDADSEAVERQLVKLRLAYSKWSSGNRGHHYGISRSAQASDILPALDKQWCEENIPQADLKLYSHLHLFRRPGHVHEKTGRPKVLVSESSGETLDLQNYELKPQEPRPSASSLSTSIFEDEDIMNLAVPYSDGNRHRMFIILASRLADRGEPYEFALGWVENVNRLGDPLPTSKIQSIVEWAYFKRVGRTLQGEVA